MCLINVQQINTLPLFIHAYIYNFYYFMYNAYTTFIPTHTIYQQSQHIQLSYSTFHTLQYYIFHSCPILTKFIQSHHISHQTIHHINNNTTNNYPIILMHNQSISIKSTIPTNTTFKPISCTINSQQITIPILHNKLQFLFCITAFHPQPT